jgi:hypothetical protein
LAYLILNLLALAVTFSPADAVFGVLCSTVGDSPEAAMSKLKFNQEQWSIGRHVRRTLTTKAF